MLSVRPREPSSPTPELGALPLLAFAVLALWLLIPHKAYLSAGMKTTVSEAEHPLLCEGTRREKGELALTLMITYKDDQAKLKKVRDRGPGLMTEKLHPLSHGVML